MPNIIDRALNIIPEEIDFTNEKSVNEQRGEVYKGLVTAHQKASAAERAGNKEEDLSHQVNYYQLREKLKTIDNLANQNNIQMHVTETSVNPNGNQQNSKLGEPGFLGGDSEMNKKGGGKSLNESGSIRMYRPDEKLTASQPKGEVDLGGFLRSVVDKPRTNAERQMIQNSVDSSGYSMPNSVAMELIDKLRAVNPVIAAGARTISIDGLESTKFVKLNQDPDAVWHTELEEEQLGDPTFGAVEMKPKTVLAMTEVSREVMQDSQNIDEALTLAFVGSINQAILEATFSGGGGNAPTGMATTVTQNNEYANAGSPDWGNFVSASRTLHDQNIPTEGRSFIHAPDIWETLALIQDDNGRYQDAPSFIRNVPNLTSSGVPEGVAYAGDFSNMVYGFRLNITLEQYNALSVRKYGTIWLAAARLDIATFRPSAFVRVEEAAAT